MYKSGQTTRTTFFYILMFAISVASSLGPMLTDLINRGHRATVAVQLQSLKIALTSFKNDLKHFPFTGTDPFNAAAYVNACSPLFSTDSSSNFLMKREVKNKAETWQNMGLHKSVYARRWRGPYMPAQTQSDKQLRDLWGNKIAYYATDEGKFLRIFLHSPGPDGRFDIIAKRQIGISDKLADLIDYGRTHNWKFSSDAIVDAHHPLYEGDDIVLEVATIRKPMTASRAAPANFAPN